MNRLKYIHNSSKKFSRNHLLSIAFNPWFNNHKKIKFRQFLVVSVLKNYRKDIMKRKFMQWIKYIQYKKQKKENYEEAFSIFEKRKREAVLQAFVVGSKYIDVLESDSDYSSDEIELFDDNETEELKVIQEPLKLEPFDVTNINFQLPPPKKHIFYTHNDSISSNGDKQNDKTTYEFFVEITKDSKPKVLNAQIKEAQFLEPKIPHFLMSIKKETAPKQNPQIIKEKIKENSLSKEEIQNEIKDLASQLQNNQSKPRTQETKAEAVKILSRLKEITQILQSL